MLTGIHLTLNVNHVASYDGSWHKLGPQTLVPSVARFAGAVVTYATGLHNKSLVQRLLTRFRAMPEVSDANFINHHKQRCYGNR